MSRVQLEWEGHDKAMSTKLWEFFNEEYLVDFSVTCHGQQMKVHKFVLALMFPILKESLRSTGAFPFDHQSMDARVCGGGAAASTMPVPQGLNLDNIADHAEDMDYLIQFAYTGKTTVPNEHADCLMRIADNMEIQSLKDSLSRWNVENSRRADQTERNIATMGRLRPRIQLKKIDSDRIGVREQVRRDRVPRRSATLLAKNAYRVSRVARGEGAVQCRKRATNKKMHNNEATKKLIISAASVLVSLDSSNSQESLQSETAADDPKRANADKTVNENEGRAENDANNQNSLREEEEEEPTTTPSGDQIEDGDKSLKCPHCDYVAGRPYFLNRHLQCHSNKRARRFTCEMCKKVFGTRNMFQIHCDSKCGKELPHECKYCGHKTLRRVVLLQHMAAKHKVDGSGNPLQRNVQCPLCNFVCFAKHQLRRHSLAKHELLNKYKCTECNYTAPFRNDLLKHERIMHQHRRDYMCEECGFQSQTSGGLTRHVMIKHKGIKPHKCEVCGAEYCDSVSFKIHKQKHTGGAIRNHVCHICGQGFFRRDHLRVHCRCKHKVELGPAKPNYEFPKSSSNAAAAAAETNDVSKEIRVDDGSLMNC